MKHAPFLAVVAAFTVLAACGRSSDDAQPQPAEPASPPVAEISVAAPADDDAAPVEAAREVPEPVTAEEPAPPPPVEQPAPPPVAPPEPAARPAAFARCQACHSVDPGGRHGIGPNLSGVMGAAVGSRPGYDYSDAMSAFEGVWTDELMDAFLLAPRDAVPGTKMMAPPVRDAAERRALIDYLRSL